MVCRHAYLIMCHTNIKQLLILLSLLDDERNDVYLHIDKKTTGYSIENIKHSIKKSNLYLVNSITVSWGGDSQIKAELQLLSEAIKTFHSYYHLISGMDLPLKTQNEIHSFFLEHNGLDFVSLEKTHPHNLSKSYMYRLNYYYLFQNLIGRNKNGFVYKLQEISLNIQKRFNICRTKNSLIKFQKGSNWFSITHKTACFVLNEFSKYNNQFRFTLCADEIFLQTILINSSMTSTIIDDNLRFIDWSRGGPYTFRIEDYDSLIHSEKLFARKFDMTIDDSIIKKIQDFLQKQSE